MEGTEVMGVLLNDENERPLSDGMNESDGTLACLRLGLDRLPPGLELRLIGYSRLGLEFSLLLLDILGSEVGLYLYSLSYLKVGIFY